MSAAVEHVAEDNCVFKQDSALAHHACNSQTPGARTLKLHFF